MNFFLITAICLIIAVFLVLLYGKRSFENRFTAAKSEIEDQSTKALIAAPVTENELAKLPQPVAHWLRQSGALGKEPVRLLQLKQTGLIRLKPEQPSWVQSESEQIINLEEPSFVWNVNMSMSGLPVLGMDHFTNGEGRMWITLFGLIPIVNVRQHPKINQSALQRFLGEIVWAPTAALSPFIEWQAIDNSSAKAIMSYKGTSGEAIFHFNESGAVIKFVALRFKEVTDEKPLEWHADIKEHKIFGGFRVPSSLEATWYLPEGPFTWFKFEIKDIQYQ